MVCRRTRRGPRTNVPQRRVLHSPTGLEWGYAGSGPSDLALNVLLAFGCEYMEAVALHQEFKREFVATMPREGGRIPAKTVHRWIAERTPLE